ncbi:hypothetical protein PSYMO_00155 [Pseudomonas amygdali pv. mori str. 301020]|uniref:Uncharacterized protein n=2 Tax=Pseudomonas syringae group genomosp. 2 TaxID=251698 RepID=A0A656G382_PSEA0|nr:hypothetical protein PsgB076_25279 [Pseudomonas savastanoi pv. glycinea str. B076]EGH06944.1 hypothetical protein Pgy4_03432 [Pseudomonas savastanoi pv. glycinea str. race 4]EGH19975.1 hypothetical protein PSYMO_00155 [Pseudomonas amygdali pv. mori str. 301020]
MKAEILIVVRAHRRGAPLRRNDDDGKSLPKGQ